MVTAAVFINYIDRGNLATAAPLLATELHLDEEQLGILLSAFYFGYVPLMPAMGWLAEKFGAKAILALGVTIWSIATLSTGFAATFGALLGLRVLLGVGESAAFPCASKVIAQSVPVHHLGLANGVLSGGYLVGPAVGTALGGMLMIQYGWRVVFIAFGAASLLWLIPWRTASLPASAEPALVEADAAGTASVEAVPERAPMPVPSFARILRERALWGASLGHFASNYSYYFIVSWLPFYLVKSRGFSLDEMVQTTSSAYLVNAVSALAMGWMADRWIRNGRSPTLVYKSIMAANHVAGIACIGAMAVLPATGAIIALFVFEIVSGASYPGLFAIPQIMAGPAATGRWVGVQNAAGNGAGLVAPILTGVLVKLTGSFDSAFALAAGVNLLGFVGWVLILPRIAACNWSEPPSAATPAAA
jgi:MFS family permease